MSCQIEILYAVFFQPDQPTWIRRESTREQFVLKLFTTKK